MDVSGRTGPTLQGRGPMQPAAPRCSRGCAGQADGADQSAGAAKGFLVAVGAGVRPAGTAGRAADRGGHPTAPS